MDEAEKTQRKARELWTKARDLYRQTGMPHMVEKLRGRLDDLPDDEPH